MLGPWGALFQTTWVPVSLRMSAGGRQTGQGCSAAWTAIPCVPLVVLVIIPLLAGEVDLRCILDHHYVPNITPGSEVRLVFTLQQASACQTYEVIASA